MHVYSRLFSTELKNLHTEKYEKIKTQVTGLNQDGGPVKEFTYSLVDESQKFNIAQFIRDVTPILIRFKINFAVSYILNEETGLRYYHQSHNNSCLLPLAFVITSSEDLTRFKDEFLHGNWLALNTHVLLRSTTKVNVICLTSITFYVYVADGVYQFVGSPPNDIL